MIDRRVTPPFTPLSGLVREFHARAARLPDGILTGDARLDAAEEVGRAGEAGARGGGGEGQRGDGMIDVLTPMPLRDRLDALIVRHHHEGASDDPAVLRALARDLADAAAEVLRAVHTGELVERERAGRGSGE